jgi:hypothetical protein
MSQRTAHYFRLSQNFRHLTVNGESTCAAGVAAVLIGALMILLFTVMTT